MTARRRPVTVAHVRRDLYRSASTLGDWQALASGNPSRIVRRYARKRLGRSFGRVLRRV